MAVLGSIDVLSKEFFFSVQPKYWLAMHTCTHTYTHAHILANASVKEGEVAILGTVAVLSTSNDSVHNL